MYKLAFDLRTTHLSGIHRYGTCLLQGMKNILPETDFKIYALYRPESQQQIIGTLGQLADNNHQIELVAVPGDYGFIRDSAWLRNWLVEEGIQIYYSSHYLVDPELPIPFTFTIHDLVRLKYPDVSSYTDEAFRDKFGLAEFEKMEEELQKIGSFIPDNYTKSEGKDIFHQYFWAINRCLSQRSKHLFTGANAIRKDINDILGIPPSKVSIIPDAIEPGMFYPKPDTEITTVCQQFDIPKRYCLFVGLAHKRKRLPWLLDAISRHRDRFTNSSALVMIGGHYDLFQGLQELVASYNLTDFIIFTGRVTDHELVCLYSGATALIVSSLDEGFCLPALEALACNTEVIAPTIGAVQEAIGEYGHFYDLTDKEQLSKLLIAAYNNQLSPKVVNFKNRFSWSKSASKLLNSIQSIR